MLKRCTDHVCLLIGTCTTLYYGISPYTTWLPLLGQRLPVFYTVGGAILYCATSLYTTIRADAARVLYGWRRDRLLCYPTTVREDAARFLYGSLREPPLCYPPRTQLLRQVLPVFFMVGCAELYCDTSPYATIRADAVLVLIRLGTRSSTVLPPATLLSGQMIPVFYSVVSANIYCSTPPLHYCWGRCCPFFLQSVCWVTLHCATALLREQMASSTDHLFLRS